MPDFVIRGSRLAQELRAEFALRLDVSTDDCDRLASTLGFAAERAAKSADHPLRLLADRWDLSLAYDDGDDDARGDEHSLSRLDFVDQPYVKMILTGDGSDDANETRLRRSLNAGYRHLNALCDRMGRDARRVVSVVADCVAAAADGGGMASCLPFSGPIQIELGTDVETHARVEWVVNREDLNNTSANLRIAGTQGKGKTQALLGLIQAIAEASPATGFIFLDYKGDLDPAHETGKLFLKSVANVRYIRPPEQPVPINPFDLPIGANAELAPQIFSSTLAAFLPLMGAYQQGLVDKALENAYSEARQGGRSGPSIRQARDAVRRIYDQEGRKDDSVTLALNRLADKPIFSPLSEGIDVGNVFQERWVIDLSKLGELRTYVAFILLHFLNQVAQGICEAPRENNIRTLRGIVAIDEAHNYLTKGKKCQPLESLVRIGRSKGVPVFLSSQSLEDFKGNTAWSELIANTLVFGHGLPPEAETLQGALRVDRRAAKEASSDCVSLDQFVVFTNFNRGLDGSPRKMRVTPLYERVDTR